MSHSNHSTTILRRKVPRAGYSLSLLIAIVVVALYTSRPVNACDVWNPLCWLEEGIDYLWDDV